MKRNLISVPQQRSRSTFLKCRAPYAAARSLAADERSPPRGPPTAASLALWGAASPPPALAQPHAVPPSGATLNRAGQVKVDRDLCWGTEMRFRFIKDRHADYPVTILCEVLEVSS